MRGSALEIGVEYELMRGYRGIYDGVSSEPAYAHRPYRFRVMNAGAPNGIRYTFHIPARDVLRPWAEVEAQNRRDEELKRQRMASGVLMKEFLARRGVTADHRYLGGSARADVKLSLSSHPEASRVEMSFATLLKLLGPEATAEWARYLAPVELREGVEA